MDVRVRLYEAKDLPDMVRIWNEVIEAGIYYVYDEKLTEQSAAEMFAEQTAAVVAEDEAGRVRGMYIMHPNSFGRCGHIANATYAVEEASRGQGIGEMLVRDSISRAKDLGFRLLQFNCVVEDNLPARHLYEKLGFTRLGVIPGGMHIKDGSYANMCPYYIEL